MDMFKSVDPFEGIRVTGCFIKERKKQEAKNSDYWKGVMIVTEAD